MGVDAQAPAKKAKVEVPTVTLNNGAKMPVVGLGTWKSKPGEVKQAVEAALECGYRHLDCAAIYGNEGEVGEGLKASGVDRKEVFITSKLWNAFHAGADVEDACKDTLAKLGTDYLDLYLIHWPICLRKGHPMPPTPQDFIDVPVEETWRAMEQLVEKGLVKAIGVSNFNEKRLQEIISLAKVQPAMNQVESHPYLQQQKLKDFCESKKMFMTAYGPLGSPDRPPRCVDESDPVLMEDKTLCEIAKNLDRSPADVLLRWAVQRGSIVIPKSVTPARIESNLKAALNPLPEDAMQKLKDMDRHLRLFNGKMWAPEGTTGPIKDAKVDLWNDP